LPTAVPERAGHALPPPGALRPPAPPAAAEALGHEDRRNPVPPLRRRGHDDRPIADGGRIAGPLRASAGDRDRRVAGPGLATSAYGPGRHSGGGADELRLRAAGAADLPRGAERR